ncbi:hypothetical protein ROU88_08225 [Macrococcus capreoli]|uniref:hypothetical protein n=1 Tax=Macrococcus capreoli TaxID=2982690 RepID=UPI003F4328E5
MNNTLTSIANILEFTYDTSGQLSDEWTLFDVNQKGIYYRHHFVGNLKVDNKKSTLFVSLRYIDRFFRPEFTPHQFVMSGEAGTTSSFNDKPHNFVIMKKQSLESGTQALEIRVKNKQGQWGNWQLISDKFYVMRIQESDGRRGLQSPIDDSIEEFKNNFQIRYSGLIHKSHYDEISIVGEDYIYRLNQNTGYIEYQMDFENQCYPFEYQLEDLLKFKEKYYRFDAEGNRL